MSSHDREPDAVSEDRSRDESSVQGPIEHASEEVSTQHRTSGVDVRELLVSWKELFERQDADGLAELYRSDALLEVSDLSIQAYGKVSIRELLHRAVEGKDSDVPSLIRWELVAADDRLAAVEYRIEGGLLGGEGLAMFGTAPGGIAFDKRFLRKRH